MAVTQAQVLAGTPCIATLNKGGKRIEQQLLREPP